MIRLLFVRRLAAFSCLRGISNLKLPSSQQSQICGFQLTKLWGKTLTRIGVWPQAIGRRFYGGYTFFLLNIYTNSNTYQLNEIDIKLRKTILSTAKSLQIRASVTKRTWSPCKYGPKIAWKYGCKFSDTWLIGILARYCSFEHRFQIFSLTLSKSTFVTSYSMDVLSHVTLLTRIEGNWLSPRYGIVNTAIRDRPYQLIFHKLISYLIVEADNSRIMRVTRTIWNNYRYSARFFVSNCLYSVVAITSTVLKSRNLTNNTILTKILIDIQGTEMKYI